MTVCGNHLHAFHHLPFAILMRQICIFFLLQKTVHFKNTLQCVEKAIPSVYIFLIYQDFVSSCVVKNMIDKFEVATRGCLHQNSSPICRRLTTGAVIDQKVKDVLVATSNATNIQCKITLQFAMNL